MHHHLRDAQHAEDNDQGVHGFIFAKGGTCSRGASCHLHPSPGDERAIIINQQKLYVMMVMMRNRWCKACSASSTRMVGTMGSLPAE